MNLKRFYWKFSRYFQMCVEEIAETHYQFHKKIDEFLTRDSFAHKLVMKPPRRHGKRLCRLKYTSWHSHVESHVMLMYLERSLTQIDDPRNLCSWWLHPLSDHVTCLHEFSCISFGHILDWMGFWKVSNHLMMLIATIRHWSRYFIIGSVGLRYIYFRHTLGDT